MNCFDTLDKDINRIIFGNNKKLKTGNAKVTLLNTHNGVVKKLAILGMHPLTATMLFYLACWHTYISHELLDGWCKIT